jgi:histidinol-phosphatase
VFASELAFAHELADLAASIALRFVAEDLLVRHKPDATPVTQVDVEIERALRSAVATRFPGDDVLGEEEGAGTPGERTWVIDPIDGTRSFIAGIQLWATLIALVVDGVPVVGVIGSPGLRERYDAVRGRGARLNGSPIRVSDISSLSEAVVLHSGVRGWLRGRYWAGFRHVAETSARTEGLADFWGHVLVARGSADVFLEHEPCQVWDWMAAKLVLEEAGGAMTTLDGGTPHHACNLLSTNGRLHRSVLEVLASAGDGAAERAAVD